MMSGVLLRWAVSLLRPLYRLVAALSPVNQCGREPGQCLILDAGPKGWELIEYEELYSSACEYLGSENVQRLVVSENTSYLRLIHLAARSGQATHYFFDPRSGSQAKVIAVVQAIALGCLCAWYKVIPIARITDMAMGRWKVQASLLTAAAGVIVTLMGDDENRRSLPHSRYCGPLPMPLSAGTISSLPAISPTRGAGTWAYEVLFTGSLYEPRTTTLHRLSAILAGRGIELTLITRPAGGHRDSNDAYWRRLSEARVVFTTADQLVEPGDNRKLPPHLIYRYTEALAVGTALVAPAVPSAEDVFRPGLDYVAFTDLEDAADKISRLLSEDDYRQTVASTGHERMAQLVHEQYFWNNIWEVLDRGC